MLFRSRIGHVNQSVGALDEMTQQNAALVEEGAAAADSLKEQAGRLTEMVGAFRLTRDGRDENSWSARMQAPAASPVPVPAARASLPSSLKPRNKLPSLPR